MNVFIYYGNDLNKSSGSNIFVNKLINSAKKFVKDGKVYLRHGGDMKLEYISNWKDVMNFDTKLDKQQIANEIYDSNIIILISPVFIHNVSSFMKIFLDNFAVWTHIAPLVGKVGLPISISSTNGNVFVNNYLTKIMNYWGLVTCEPVSLELGLMTEDALDSYIRQIIQTMEEIDTGGINFDTTQVEYFFDYILKTMLTYQKNHPEKILFDQLPYSNCQTFREAFEMMRERY
ncbi:NAD(P)H-dependent oxidoreductase [Dolosigranulum savutiense]|uniref:NAD(P)H-dependent oxidoreductase n=1 Tax=Dolosigranulum savutiense TaxID=3110288 RepID=A0AB74TSA7_9LACT